MQLPDDAPIIGVPMCVKHLDNHNFHTVGEKYLTALIEQDGPDERVPLCRIEYLGDDEDWGFAIYSPATDTYTDALLYTGTPTGHPTDAFDTAALVHLADYTK